jgi:predicted secreted hydrolase
MNYTGIGRTNYVRLKDEDAFMKAIEPYPVSVIRDEQGRVGLRDESEDGAGFSWLRWDDDEDYSDTDPVDLIAPHLADGEVMLIMESGNEGYRYVIGYAIAFNNKGEYRTVHLTDIHALARELGDGNFTLAVY